MKIKRPNILLLVMDAGRVDRLSCYGYDPLTTPNIDRIAKEGVLYEQAISPAVWTVPSHASLFTGMYPSGHGLKGRNLKLRSGIPTIASYLGEQGYATVALTANALIGNPTGLSRGFQTLIDVRNIVQTDRANGWQRKVNALYRRLYYGQNPSQGSWFDSGAWRINFDMKRWLRSWRKQSLERPFFIFTNYMEPHLNYDPPRAFRRRFLTPAQEKRQHQVNQNAWKYLSGKVKISDDDWEILNGLYNAELAYLDMRIGQVYDFLQQEGLLDETILIITSDHGENLSEHGMMDHQYCVYDTLAKVPLIIRYPDSFTAGSREKALVQTIDLFPSIAKILGATDDPALESIQGQSLLAADLQENGRDFAVTEYLAPQLHSFRRESLTFDSKFTRQLRAIRTQTHKYIWASDGDHQLYHLQTDPGETHNVIDDDPETAVALAQQLEQWISQYKRRQQDDMSIDESVVNRLEALGYI